MKIQKDNTIIECSKNTFESMYKRLGYEIISEKKEEIKKNEQSKEDTQEVAKEIIEAKKAKKK